MILEKNVWFVVLPDNRGVILAKPGLDPEEAWKNALKEKKNLNWTRKNLDKLGYRARKLSIRFD